MLNDVVSNRKYSDAESFLKRVLETEVTPDEDFTQVNPAATFITRHGKERLTELAKILESVRPNYINSDREESMRLVEFANGLLDDGMKLNIFWKLDEERKLSLFKTVSANFMLDIPEDILLICITKGAPPGNPLYQTKDEIDKGLVRRGLEPTNSTIVKRIKRYVVDLEGGRHVWSQGLWALAYHYGYNIVETVIDRIEKDGIVIDDVLLFAAIVMQYDSIKEYPLNWAIELLR